MVSMRDRALIEARAAGLDTERVLHGHWRQMLRPDIVGPAFAISIFLMLYYIAVAFFVVYFTTVFGCSASRTNNLANWFWIADAIALLACGLVSDRLLVRKPLMVVGAAIGLVGTGLFAAAATNPHTSYHTFALYFVIMAVGSAVAYVAWMAGFTETVEKHNPAATATGLAVWGWIIRLVVTISYAALTLVVPATTTLVDQGTRVQAIVAQYPTQVKVLSTVSPATLTALQANPKNAAAQVGALSQLSGVAPATVARIVTVSAGGATAIARLPAAQRAVVLADGPKVGAAAKALSSLSAIPRADVAYLSANAAKVSKAQRDNPGQWQTWWWICFAAQVLFIPFVLLMSGFWNPRRARQAEREHEQMVERELARLQGEHSTA
jgi:hypothetical protein